MFTLISYTKLGQVYKIKRFAVKPTFGQVNRLINRWSVQYGAHLNYEVK